MSAGDVDRIRQWMREQIAREARVPVDQIDPEQSPLIYGLGSVELVSLSGEAERFFNVKLSPALAFEHPTINAMAAHLASLTPADDASGDVSPADAEMEYPLSSGQAALWLQHQITPESGVYNMGQALRLRGPLNESAWRRALQGIIERHEILRTTFHMRPGSPAQCVHDGLDVPMEWIDARNLSSDELLHAVNESHRRPFDLERGPVFRASLFHRSDLENVFLLSIHHIAFDGWSMGLFFDELMTRYAAICEETDPVLPPTEARYADYVRVSENWASSEPGQRECAYWLRKLSGPLPLLNLPIDRQYPRRRTLGGGSVPLRLEAGLGDSVRRFAGGYQTTPFVVLLSAFAALLHRYGGQEDLILGSPSASRHQPRFNNLLGYLVNMICLRVSVSSGDTFESLTVRVRNTVLEALKNQEYPFPLMAARLKGTRDPRRTPIFQATFALHHFPRFNGVASLAMSGDQETSGRVAGLTISRFPVALQEAQHELSLDFFDTAGHFSGFLRFNSHLFDQSTIEAMGANFISLLRESLKTPAGRIGDIPLPLSEDEPEEREPAQPMRDFSPPRDDLEMRLVRLWEMVLSVKGIGPCDDFFELGGNSLLAVRLIAQIELTFGQRLPPAVLLQDPTVRHMADALREQAPVDDSNAVPLFTNPRGKPLFLIPGAGGQPFRFMYLAHELGRQMPIYGMQARSVTTVEAQAATFLRDIRKIQNHGPYRLGGFCYGGVVAFEMAQQLRAVGESTDFLGFIDAPAPGMPGGVAEDENLAVYPRYIQELMIASSEAYRQYRGGVYPARAVLIHIGAEPGPDEISQSNGWNRYVQGSLDIHVIPGDHGKAFNPPDVKKLAEVLLPYLQQRE